MLLNSWRRKYLQFTGINFVGLAFRLRIHFRSKLLRLLLANPREMFHAHLQASRSDPLVSQQIASFLPKKQKTNQQFQFIGSRINLLLFGRYQVLLIGTFHAFFWRSLNRSSDPSRRASNSASFVNLLIHGFRNLVVSTSSGFDCCCLAPWTGCLPKLRLGSKLWSLEARSLRINE